MSFSWADPHFAALYARREQERLVERLVTRLRERPAGEPFLHSTGGRDDGPPQNDGVVCGGHLRLL